jgi:meiotic recombination protein SPO11
MFDFTKQSNMIFTNNHIRLGTELNKKEFFKHPKGFSQIWALLSFIHDLLLNNKRATQREIYYCLVDLFKTQKEFNEVVQDVVAVLNCQRQCLGITTSARGMVTGTIEVEDKGCWLDCTKLGTSGKLISESIGRIKSEARYVIVIEKDAVFQRLAEDRISDVLPCILVTACGFPDLATRSVLISNEK